MPHHWVEYIDKVQVTVLHDHN